MSEDMDVQAPLEFVTDLSEAIEHRLEHTGMREQEQVDYLLRDARRP